MRNRLVGDAREQLPHYEKLDVKAEPEWGRWSHWGATAWAYDLAYNAFTADEMSRAGSAGSAGLPTGSGGKLPFNALEERKSEETLSSFMLHRCTRM